MSNIDTSLIDTTFPKQGQDNPSQGFRDNFFYISRALEKARDEITSLEEYFFNELVPVGDGLTYNSSTNLISLNTASYSVFGGVKIGSGIEVTEDGTISVNTGTPYILNTATSDTLGGVRIGSGIDIDGDGIISVNTGTLYSLTTATGTELGSVRIGSGIDIDGDGIISVVLYTLTTATSDTLGGVRIGSGIDIDGDGIISVNTGAQYVLTTATSNTLGGVKIGTNVNLAGDGTISVGVASTLTVGVVQIGYESQWGDAQPLQIDNNGVLNLQLGFTSTESISYTNDVYDNILTVIYDINPATTSTLGGVKIGEGINVTNGVISVDTSLPYASTTTYGVVQIGYESQWGGAQPLQISSGSLVLNINFTSTESISFTDDVYNNSPTLIFNVNTATTSTLGGIKIGSGIDIDVNGLISTNRPEVVSVPATSTSTGIVGQVAHDSSYVYICVGTDTWVRSSIDPLW